MNKIYNLKKEYNWRGRVAELLAKYELNAFMTKGYAYDQRIRLNKKETAFLRKHWNTIDLYRINIHDGLEIFEIKARSEGVKRRPDITSKSMKCYEKADKLKIPIKLVYVYFLDNKKELFRENNGGWYRKNSPR